MHEQNSDILLLQMCSSKRGFANVQPSQPVDYPHTSTGEDLDVTPFSSEGLTESCSLVSRTCLIYGFRAKVQRLQRQTLRPPPPQMENTPVIISQQA